MDDRLTEMFNLQRGFQERLAKDKGASFPPPMPEIPHEIMVFAFAAMVELGEATAEVGWKPWAKSRYINREAYVGELVDVWAFFINLCLLGNITPDDLYDAYLHKVQINHKRQDDGYDGLTTKCPGCNRAYDDRATQCRRRDEHRVAWCAAVGDISSRPAWDSPTQFLPQVTE